MYSSKSVSADRAAEICSASMKPNTGLSASAHAPNTLYVFFGNAEQAAHHTHGDTTEHLHEVAVACGLERAELVVDDVGGVFA